MIPDLVLPPVFDKVISILPQDKPIYLVGGAVRDLILGREFHDLDFVMAEGAGKTARRVANSLNGSFYMLDEERDTARVILPMENESTYTLDFSVFRGPDLQADLAGRDFTVNSLAINLCEPGKTIDPLDGWGDLQTGRLRASSPSSFTDDPVRILRGVRLARSLGFTILPETMSAMQAAVEQISRISPERQRDELVRILEGSQVKPAITLLDQLGVIRLILTEVVDLKEVTQSSPHVFDVWNHTLLTLTYLEQLLDGLAGIEPSGFEPVNSVIKTAVRKLERFRMQLSSHFEIRLNPGRTRRGLLFLAAIFHDIGKPVSRQEIKTGKITFYGHECSGVAIMQKRLETLAFSVGEVEYVKTVIMQHMRLHFMVEEGLLPSRRTIYRFFRDTGQAGVDICLLSLADILATFGNTLPPEKWLAEVEVSEILLEAWWEHQKEVVHPGRLVTGFDLQERFGLKPGPLIGRILAELEEAQACGEAVDQAGALLFVKDWLEQNGEKAFIGGMKLDIEGEVK